MKNADLMDNCVMQISGNNSLRGRSDSKSNSTAQRSQKAASRQKTYSKELKNLYKHNELSEDWENAKAHQRV